MIAWVVSHSSIPPEKILSSCIPPYKSHTHKHSQIAPKSPKMAKLLQNPPKWPKCQNCSKMAKFLQNRPKLPNCSKIAQNSPNCCKIGISHFHKDNAVLITSNYVIFAGQVKVLANGMARFVPYTNLLRNSTSLCNDQPVTVVLMLSPNTNLLRNSTSLRNDQPGDYSVIYGDFVAIYGDLG